MKTDKPGTLGQNSKPEVVPAVTVYELNDPSTAGEDMEILDQDIVHLGSTPFSAKRVVVNLDKSMFVFHTCSHRVRSRTKVHPAMMVFLVVGPTSSASIDGLDIDSNALVTGEPGVDVEIVVEGGYESATLMIPPTELMQHLRGRGRDEIFQMPSGAEIWHSGQLELSKLFELGKRLADTAINEPTLINESVNVRAAAHNELLECYLASIQVGEHSEPSRTDQTTQRYSRIVRNAQEYVMEQHGVGYSVTDICNVTNTSERTLQYAFRKILDMTPIEYLIRLRLHRARQNLLEENEESASVSRVAVDWGFWHLGEFSIAYRNCFDEMPSQTLSRSPDQQ